MLAPMREILRSILEFLQEDISIWGLINYNISISNGGNFMHAANQQMQPDYDKLLLKTRDDWAFYYNRIFTGLSTFLNDKENHIENEFYAPDDNKEYNFVVYDKEKDPEMLMKKEIFKISGSGLIHIRDFEQNIEVLLSKNSIQIHDLNRDKIADIYDKTNMRTEIYYEESPTNKRGENDETLGIKIFRYNGNKTKNQERPNNVSYSISEYYYLHNKESAGTKDPMLVGNENAINQKQAMNNEIKDLTMLFANYINNTFKSIIPEFILRDIVSLKKDLNQSIYDFKPRK